MISLADFGLATFELAVDAFNNQPYVLIIIVITLFMAAILVAFCYVMQSQKIGVRKIEKHLKEHEYLLGVQLDRIKKNQ